MAAVISRERAPGKGWAPEGALLVGPCQEETVYGAATAKGEKSLSHLGTGQFVVRKGKTHTRSRPEGSGPKETIWTSGHSNQPKAPCAEGGSLGALAGGRGGGGGALLGKRRAQQIIQNEGKMDDWPMRIWQQQDTGNTQSHHD